MPAPSEEKQILTAFTLDFETGGLDCQKSACTQIALHAIRLDTFERIDRLVLYIYPYKQQLSKVVSKRKTLKSKNDIEEEANMEYSDKALEYSGITLDMLRNKGQDIKDVAFQVIEFIKKNTLNKGRSTKPFLIGQNILFDIGFFQQLMAYGGLTKEFEKVLRGVKDYYGNFQPYYQDTIIEGQLAMCHLDGISSYKLEIMAENLGVELDDAHDADADVAATTNVLSVMVQRMRSIGGTDSEALITNKGEKTRTHFKI